MISLRLAGYMILHVLGGWAAGGQVASGTFPTQ